MAESFCAASRSSPVPRQRPSTMRSSTLVVSATVAAILTIIAGFWRARPGLPVLSSGGSLRGDSRRRALSAAADSASPAEWIAWAAAAFAGDRSGSPLVGAPPLSSAHARGTGDTQRRGVGGQMSTESAVGGQTSADGTASRVFGDGGAPQAKPVFVQQPRGGR